MNRQQIVDAVNYEACLAESRCGQSILDVLFKGSAETIAEWVEDDWQGEMAFAYQFQDGTVVVVTDYFGSCDYCDGWMGATDEDLRNIVRSCASSSRIFETLDEAIEKLEGVEDRAEDYSHRAAVNLVETLKGRKEGCES